MWSSQSYYPRLTEKETEADVCEANNHIVEKATEDTGL